MTNTIKTFFFLAVLTVIFVFVGGALGGRAGMTFALMMACGMNFFAYWFSDKIALQMSGAQQVSETERPQLYSIVTGLAQKAGIPRPRVYVIPKGAPNAFATGRDPDHAAVAVTEGLLRTLSPEELEGVLSHEFAHIRNRDILISSVAAVMAGAISYIASMAQWGMLFGGFGRSDDDDGMAGLIGELLMIVLAPIAAALIQMAISRSREYQADATGARICNNPMSLANALKKLEAGNQRIPMEVNPATAQMYIVNPLTSASVARLFSTHPPTEERIRRLMAMAGHREV